MLVVLVAVPAVALNADAGSSAVVYNTETGDVDSSVSDEGVADIEGEPGDETTGSTGEEEDEIDFANIDLSLDYSTLMRQALKEGTTEALRQGERYERCRNYKIQVLGMSYIQTNFFSQYQTAEEIRAAWEAAEEEAYWNKLLSGLDTKVDYSKLMKDCCRDGSALALERGKRLEELRNEKIRTLGWSNKYLITNLFTGDKTGEEILAEWAEKEAEFAAELEAKRKAEEEAKIQAEADAKAKKIERLKKEHSVAGQVYEYLNAKGYSDVCIAGILGNMMAECGGQTLELSPYLYSSDQYTTYYGLCQWGAGWGNSAVQGADVKGQLDYLMSNIVGNMGYFYGAGGHDVFCKMTDAGDAAAFFQHYYERGAGESQRRANAKVAYSWITK